MSGAEDVIESGGEQLVPDHGAPAEAAAEAAGVVAPRGDRGRHHRQLPGTVELAATAPACVVQSETRGGEDGQIQGLITLTGPLFMPWLSFSSHIL